MCAECGGNGASYCFRLGARDRVNRMRPNPRWFAVAATACLLTGCGRIPTSPSAVQSSSPALSGATTTCEFVETGTAARPVQLPSATGVETSGTVTYLLQMTNGPVRLTLDRVKAPCSVHSFESLADQGFFTKTRCPRLVDKKIFILQCGDRTGTDPVGAGQPLADDTH